MAEDLSSLLGLSRDLEISGGGGATPGSIMGFIQGLQERNQKQKSQLKAAQAIRDTFDNEPDPVTGEVKPNPLGTKDAFTALSAQDQIASASGLIKGMVTKNVLQELAQRKQAFDLQQQLGAQALARGKQDQAANAAFSTAMRNAGTSVPPIETPGRFGGLVAPSGRFGPVTEQSMLGAMQENPESFNAPQADNVLQVIARAETARNAARNPLMTTFAEDPVTGARYAERGGSLQPSGFNPDKQGSTATPIMDGDKTVGFAYRAGKTTNVHWLPEGGYPADARIESQNGVNVVVDKNGRILKTIGQSNPFGILLNPGGTSTSSAPASQPAGSKSKTAQGGYKVGTVYGGLKYLGGDPNDQSNWQRSR